LNFNSNQKGTYEKPILRFAEWKNDTKPTVALGYAKKSLIVCLDF